MATKEEHVEEYQFSVGDQVEEMVNAVTSISGNSYLQHVVITTVDYTGFINAEEKLLQTQQDNRWFPTLRSSKPVWLRVYAEGKPQGTISIQLIGLNENELEEAKMKIQKLAKNKVSHEMLKHSIAEESAVDEEEKIDDADVCILGDVTAEVNPGIVNYQKKSSEVFTLWKKQIESHFKIKFLDEKEKLKISGSLKSIMKVEQYLDNDFPTLLDDKNEEMLQSIGQSEINPVVDYYEYPQHKFEVEFTQQEKEAFALFQDDFSAITEQIQRFTWKENIMEITCDQKYEAEVHQKIEKLKKKINEDLRTDEIILNGNETEHMENACKTTHLQFNSVLILTDQNRIKMMALDYETLNKASTEHHKRKIIEPETQMQNEDKTNKTDWSKSDTTLVYERNGISVLIYVSDIMTAIVEGIVSSSNPNLLPIGGVAKKISDAADKEFVEECRQIVSANGHLATSECRVTSAGHLKYKNVLHVVVPVKEYGERGETLHGKLQKLSLAVLNCLQKAETCGLSSVALPCLGAGNSGFPIDLCAQEYYRALQSFGKARRSSKKMEVHFVDIDPQNIQKVKAMFEILSKQSNPTEKKIGQFTPQPESKPSSPESEVSRSSIQNRCLSNTINTSLGVKSCSEFSWPSGKVKVYVVEGDITRVNTEAIVSTESKNFDGNGAIARQIMDLAGEKHRTSYNWEKSVKHSSTDVIAIPVDGQMMCRYVLHAISPHWTCSYCQQNQAFSSDISLTVQNILMKASELDIQSVAIPFFGTSDDEEKRPTPVQTCCGAIVDGILQFIDPRRTPSSAKNSIVEVCLISTDPVVVYQWIEHIQNSNRSDYQQLVQHQALQHVSCKNLESAV